MKRSLLVSTIILTLLQSVSSEPIEKIAAIVNNNIILMGEIDSALRYNLNQKNIAPSSLTRQELQEQRENMLQIMIDSMLIEQEVTGRLSQEQKDKILQAVEQLTNQEMEKLRARFKTPEQLAEFEERQGLSWNEIRQMTRKRIYKDYLAVYVVPRMLPQKITPPTPEEVERFKQEHPEITVEDSLLIAHILLRVPENATDEVERSILLRAQEIAMRARSGESFEDLVQQYSEHTTTKTQGGRLPEFKKGDYYEEFDQLFDLKENEISQPIRTPLGYHVVKILQRKSIEDIILQEKGRQVTREWLDTLREKAKIEIRLKDNS